MFFLALHILGNAAFILLVRVARGRQFDYPTAGLANYATAALVAGLALVAADLPSLDWRAAFFGTINGLQYQVTYVLMFVLFGLVGVAVTSSFLRLSVAVPVLASIVIWQEWPAPVQAAGLGLAAAALPLLSSTARRPRATSPAGAPLPSIPHPPQPGHPAGQSARATVLRDTDLAPAFPGTSPRRAAHSPASAPQGERGGLAGPHAAGGAGRHGAGTRPRAGWTARPAARLPSDGPGDAERVMVHTSSPTPVAHGPLKQPAHPVPSRLAVATLIGATILISGCGLLAAKAFAELDRPEQRPVYVFAVYAAATLLSILTWPWRARFQARRTTGAGMRAAGTTHTLASIALGAVIGLVNVGQIWVLLPALAAVPGVIAFPLASAGGLALAALGSWLIWHEPLGGRTGAGILLAILAAALVNTR